MKSLLLLISIISLSSFAAEVKPTNGPSPEVVKAVKDLYGAGTVSIGAFGSYRLQDFHHTDDRVGAGALVQYMVVKNVAIEVSALSEGIDDHSFVDSINEASANLKAYLPLGKSGLAPYALVGYTREFVTAIEPGRCNTGRSGDDNDRFNVGAGLELRGEYLFAFGDVQWTHAFDSDELNHYLGRLGVGVHF